jgi:hypothetical protein
VDIFNAGYGTRLPPEQVALESTNINTAFQVTWGQLDIRKCHVRSIDLTAHNSANTPNVFQNERISNVDTGRARLTVVPVHRHETPH